MHPLLLKIFPLARGLICYQLKHLFSIWFVIRNGQANKTSNQARTWPRLLGIWSAYVANSKKGQ